MPKSETVLLERKGDEGGKGVAAGEGGPGCQRSGSQVQAPLLPGTWMVEVSSLPVDGADEVEVESATSPGSESKDATSNDNELELTFVEVVFLMISLALSTCFATRSASLGKRKP